MRTDIFCFQRYKDIDLFTNYQKVSYIIKILTVMNIILSEFSISKMNFVTEKLNIMYSGVPGALQATQR